MKFLKILLLLFSLSLFSQDKMEFNYKVTAAGTLFEPLNDNSDIIKPYIEKMEAELEDLTYTLRIKGKESYWFLQKASAYPNSHMGKALGGGHSYYFDGKHYIEQREFLESNFIVQNDPKDFKWELLDETKQILGYTCKKAISKETKLINGENKTFETIAWYCPELKYNVGPQYFGGLDGLILELTDKKRKFYCSEILSSEKMSMFVMAKPSKGKPVTEEEFIVEMNRIQQEKGFPIKE